MAPVNLLCKGFLRSLAESDHPPTNRNKSQHKSSRSSSAFGDGPTTYGGSGYDQPMLLDADDDDILTSDPITMSKLNVRKELLTSQQASKPNPNIVSDQQALDQQLRHLMHRTFSLSI